jgi:hypothetical protein
VSNVLVQIQSVAAQDIKLQPGTAAQTVTVNGGAQQLQSESSDLGGVIAAKQIVELPLALGGEFRPIRSIGERLPESQ